MNLEQTIAKLLTKKRLTISVAESCTGGLISNRLTNISGSSKYFKSGIIAYSNKIKTKQLKIPSRIIKQYGAVSKEVAISMAKNIRRLTKSDFGLGTTGIAGPTGATKTKPVGLVYIALASPRKIQCQEFYFHGNRQAVRLRASQAALDLVRRYPSGC